MIDYDKVFNSVGLEEDWVNATNSRPPVEPTGKMMYWRDLCRQFNYTQIECEDETDPTYDKDECEEIANGKVPWPGPQCFTAQKPLDFVYVK